MTPSLSFLSIGTLTVDPTWRMHAHCHDCNELLVVERGRMVVRGEGAELRVRAGDVLLYPAGAKHAEASEGSVSVEMVYMLFAGAIRGVVRAVHDHDGRLRTLAGWLLAARGDTYDGASRQARWLLVAMHEELLRLESRTDTSPLVESVRGAIYGNLEKPLRLKQLAAVARMSEYHFIRAYKAAAGVTPMSDARRIRLEEARKMIRSTGLPLRAVADATGFANEYHFSQAFRRHFGAPPGAFRGERGP